MDSPYYTEPFKESNPHSNANETFAEARLCKICGAVLVPGQFDQHVNYHETTFRIIEGLIDKVGESGKWVTNLYLDMSNLKTGELT